MHGQTYLKDLVTSPESYLVPDDLKDSLSDFEVPDILSLYAGQQYVAAKQLIAAIIVASGRAETDFKNAINNYKQVPTRGSFHTLVLPPPSSTPSYCLFRLPHPPTVCSVADFRFQHCGQQEALMMYSIFHQVTRTFSQNYPVSDNVANSLYEQLDIDKVVEFPYYSPSPPLLSVASVGLSGYCLCMKMDFHIPTQLRVQLSMICAWN